MWLFLVASPAVAKKPPKCWVPGRIPFVGRTSIELQSATEVAQEEARRAAVEMREPRATPDGGYAVVKVERIDIEMADVRTQLIVVEQGGAEVLRYQPEDWDPANGPSGMYKYWWNMIAVPLANTEFPITVHVVDTVTAFRCSWEWTNERKSSLTTVR